VLYARAMTTRDIRAHLREMYQVKVSPPDLEDH
jgi:transposase-like protein